jgi:hypothetical protein
MSLINAFALLVAAVCDCRTIPAVRNTLVIIMSRRPHDGYKPSLAGECRSLDQNFFVRLT